MGQKRAAPEVCTPCQGAETRRDPSSWSVQDVVQYLGTLELEHVAEQFVSNGVEGQMLLDLSQDDLQQELGLTKLQARKVKRRLG